MSTALQVSPPSPAANEPAVAVPTDQFRAVCALLIRQGATPESIVDFIYASGFIDGMLRRFK